MTVETEKPTTILVFGVLVAAVGVIAGGLAYWMTGEGFKTPGMKEIVSGPSGLESVLQSETAPPDCWPNLFGPNHDNTANGAMIDLSWPDSGPREVWNKEIGVGYSGIAIDRDRLILFDRHENEEVVSSLKAETGERVWEFRYPTAYVDRYGYNGGPRCTPIIDGDMVFTWGAEGKFHALDFATGKKIWERNLNADYNVEQAFFGVGPTPLLEGDRLIVNVGGKTAKAGIVALDKSNGKTIWTATSDGPSYATPRAATIHGIRHVFVFTEAGLVDVDPAAGSVRWSVPFRSAMYESVNATSPLVADDKVLISATYNTGSLCVQVLPDGSFRELWRDRRMPESHFSNMVCYQNAVFAFSGRHEQNCELVCIDLVTGKPHWRVDSEFGRGSSVRIGDRLLLWGERGHLGVLKLDLKAPVFESRTSRGLMRHPCWTPPSLYRGMMYLRNEQQLRCYDLRKKSG